MTSSLRAEPAWRAWAQLIRLPNLFTVWADAGAGVAAVTAAGGAVHPWAVLLLAMASACFYAGGMVLNDVIDYAIDRVERPDRPLPSGRIPWRTAAALAPSLLLAGIGLAVFADWFADSAAAVVAGLLALAIVSYDSGVKRTGLGPLNMGLCRGLNVILASQSASSGVTAVWFPAAILTTYIAGVTWLARDEAGRPARATLAFGLAALLVAFLAGCLTPWLSPRRLEPGELLAFAVIGLSFLTLNLPRLHRAWEDLTPLALRDAVTQLLRSLIILDTLLALACVGWWGLLLLLLWPPMVWLGRHVYST